MISGKRYETAMPFDDTQELMDMLHTSCENGLLDTVTITLPEKGCEDFGVSFIPRAPKNYPPDSTLPPNVMEALRWSTLQFLKESEWLSLVRKYLDVSSEVEPPEYQPGEDQ